MAKSRKPVSDLTIIEIANRINRAFVSKEDVAPVLERIGMTPSQFASLKTAVDQRGPHRAKLQRLLGRIYSEVLWPRLKG